MLVVCQVELGDDRAHAGSPDHLDDIVAVAADQLADDGLGACAAFLGAVVEELLGMVDGAGRLNGVGVPISLGMVALLEGPVLQVSDYVAEPLADQHLASVRDIRVPEDASDDALHLVAIRAISAAGLLVHVGRQISRCVRGQRLGVHGAGRRRRHGAGLDHEHLLQRVAQAVFEEGVLNQLGEVLADEGVSLDELLLHEGVLQGGAADGRHHGLLTGPGSINSPHVGDH